MVITRYVQIYEGDAELYSELIPMWTNYMSEIKANRGESADESEIEENFARRVRIQSSRHNMHFELFYIGGKLVGCANFAIDTGTVYGLLEPGYGTVMGFYIAPEHRRRGYGSLFFGHIRETLKNDGANMMYLCPESVTGEPFWSAMGFRDSGKIDPDDKLPIYIMEI